MVPRLEVSSDRLVKPEIEPATPGLQGKRFIHYTTAAPESNLSLLVCKVRRLLTTPHRIIMAVRKCFVCLFCCFMSIVKSYGHGGTVSSPNHTFSWASLDKQLTST